MHLKPAAILNSAEQWIWTTIYTRLRWTWELRETRANRQMIRKCRKHLHQCDSTWQHSRYRKHNRTQKQAEDDHTSVTVTVMMVLISKSGCNCCFYNSNASNDNVKTIRGYERGLLKWLTSFWRASQLHNLHRVSAHCLTVQPTALLFWFTLLSKKRLHLQ